jgi:polyhydroxyalkanoate synthesis regulator phasin
MVTAQLARTSVMSGLNQFVKKAFYLGVGLASYAGEKASAQWQDLQKNAQALADELVKRGELKAEEAGLFVDELMQQAQNNSPGPEDVPREPRRIEIITDEETQSTPPTATGEVDDLRAQVEALQAKLRDLQS